MDDGLRRSFVQDYRHEWEIHRHRVAAEIIRDVDAWMAQGRLGGPSATIAGVVAGGPRHRYRSAGSPGHPAEQWDVDRIVVAIGPNMDATANPLLAAAIEIGIAGPVHSVSRSTSIRRPA